MAHFANRSTLYKVMIGLATAFIAIVGLFLSLFVRQPRVEANTLEFELAKMCLQMAGVILFGAFVALSTFLFQKEWEQSRVDQVKKSDNEREDEIRKSDRIREDQRRESDNLRDERKRQDEALRSLLVQTLQAYNEVKRIRRTLKSQTGDGKISKEVYEQHLLDLSDRQLMFEHFARTVGTLDDERLRTNSCNDLKADYDGIESHLNENIKEFEQRLHSVKDKGTVPLADLEELNLFVTNTKDFKAGISNRFTRIEQTLQAALLVPLVLPRVEGRGQQVPPLTGKDT